MLSSIGIIIEHLTNTDDMNKSSHFIAIYQFSPLLVQVRSYTLSCRGRNLSDEPLGLLPCEKWQTYEFVSVPGELYHIVGLSITGGLVV